MKNIFNNIKQFSYSHINLVLSLLGGFIIFCLFALGSVLYIDKNKIPIADNITMSDFYSTDNNSNQSTSSIIKNETSIAITESVSSKTDTSLEITKSITKPTSYPESKTQLSSTTSSIYQEENNLMYKYTLDRYLEPFWSTKIVYNETLMFVQNKDGSYSPAPLLYTPVNIISVRSFDLRTEYIEGNDYTIENGRIKINENSFIPKWDYSSYYPSQSIQGQTFGCTNGGYIAFGEGRTFMKTQIAVTYTHNSKWSGIIPSNQGSKLKTTLNKLKNKEKTTIAFFGDSITTGANSSGAPGINMLPRAPIWPLMIVGGLKSYYNNDNIVYVNGALGGANTAWGTINYINVTAKNPDLVIIAFGMNDPNLSVSNYKLQIESIIDSIRSENPAAEVILVSTMLPNKEVSGFYGNQYLFEQPLKEIANARDYVAISPVTSMHTTLLEHKRYYDMTGNNVNHPNDFLARMYAQTILKTMSE